MRREQDDQRSSYQLIPVKGTVDAAKFWPTPQGATVDDQRVEGLVADFLDTFQSSYARTKRPENFVIGGIGRNIFVGREAAVASWALAFTILQIPGTGKTNPRRSDCPLARTPMWNAPAVALA